MIGGEPDGVDRKVKILFAAEPLVVLDFPFCKANRSYPNSRCVVEFILSPDAEVVVTAIYRGGLNGEALTGNA